MSGLEDGPWDSGWANIQLYSADESPVKRWISKQHEHDPCKHDPLQRFNLNT